MVTTGLFCVLFLLVAFWAGSAVEPKKIVMTRNDDIADKTPALIWFTDLMLSKNVKCTYAVIPNNLTPDCINYLKTLNPSQIELATHGFNHTKRENQTEVLAEARELMITDFGREPTSIAAPYYQDSNSYEKVAKSLGYNSQINYLYASVTSKALYTFPIDFRWEGSYIQSSTKYNGLDTFKMAYDQWYNNSSQRVFTINVHQEPLYKDPQAKENFSRSLDYMKGKGGIFFMTEEETYQEVIKT